MVWPTHKPAKGAGVGGPAKGPGVGGPAQGPAQPFTADTPTRAPVERMHALNHDAEEQAYRAEQRKLNRERRRKAWEVVEETMADPNHKDRYAAAKDTIDRLDGRAVQKTEVSGADGAPLFNAIQVSFVRPKSDVKP